MAEIKPYVQIGEVRYELGPRVELRDLAERIRTAMESAGPVVVTVEVVDENGASLILYLRGDQLASVALGPIVVPKPSEPSNQPPDMPPN